MAGFGGFGDGLMEKPPFQTDPLPEKGRPRFQKALIRWFEKYGKDYPWRQTQDPYAILVSEMMLQQTQIATVLERRYFERWLDSFPSVAELAAAPEEAVLKAWEGLGYYNRARNLQKAARAVLEDWEGIFPKEAANIEKLPGVGRYTAGAVASFAYDTAAPIVDGNVARVFARLLDFQGEVDTPAGLKQLWAWAEVLMPSRDARKYNSALMELGQRICRKSSPLCQECPVSAFCQAREPAKLPVKRGGKRTERKTEEAVFALSRAKVLLEQETGSRRKGLWKLPLHSGPASDSGAEAWPVLLRTQYGITHYRVELIVRQAPEEMVSELEKDPHRRWFALGDELETVAMAAPFRRALEVVLRQEQEAGDFRLEG